MARSRNPEDYVLVCKKPNFYFYSTDKRNLEEIIGKHPEDFDKTFWLYEKETSELVGRYSIKSAPNWIMEIYNILKNDGTTR